MLAGKKIEVKQAFISIRVEKFWKILHRKNSVSPKSSHLHSHLLYQRNSFVLIYIFSLLKQISYSY